jgi:hypothetical protein
LAGAEEMQAYLYRVLTSQVAVSEMVDQGVLMPPRSASPSGSANRRSALDDFGLDARIEARRMGEVYELLYCLENSVRELIRTSLLESLGAERWWEDGVPEKIRRSAESRARDDERAPWHSPRGDSLLVYIDFLQLGEIILHRWADFEDLLGDHAWVENYFKEMNRTRRALAHTGSLTQHDVDWMEMRVRQWLMDVG